MLIHASRGANLLFMPPQSDCKGTKNYWITTGNSIYGNKCLSFFKNQK